MTTAVHIEKKRHSTDTDVVIEPWLVRFRSDGTFKHSFRRSSPASVWVLAWAPQRVVVVAAAHVQR